MRKSAERQTISARILAGLMVSIVALIGANAWAEGISADVIETENGQILLDNFRLPGESPQSVAQEKISSKASKREALQLEIRDLETIEKDRALLDEARNQIDNSLSCEAQIKNIRGYYKGRYTDVLRVQSLLSSENVDLGSTGCDGRIGGYTLNALGSKACDVVAASEPRFTSNCSMIETKLERPSGAVGGMEKSGTNQYIWTEAESRMLDIFDLLNEKSGDADDRVGELRKTLDDPLAIESLDRVVKYVKEGQVSMAQIQGWSLPRDSQIQLDAKTILNEKLINTAFPTQAVFEDAVCDYLNNRIYDNSVEWEAVVVPEAEQKIKKSEGRCGNAARPSYLTLLSEITAKQQPPIENTVDYANDDCGCAQPQDSAAIYGLYPFWLQKEVIDAKDESNGNEASGGTPFDFSLYNKIEFLAGSLTASVNTGVHFELEDNNLDKNNHRALFVNESNRHLSEVEMLIFVEPLALSKLEELKEPERLALAKGIAKRFFDDNFSGVTFWLPVVGESEDKLIVDNHVSEFAKLVSALRSEIGENEVTSGFNLAKLIPSIIPSAFAKEVTADEEKKQLDLAIQRRENLRPAINMMIAGTFEQSTRTMDHFRTLIHRAYAAPPSVIDKQLVFLTQPTTDNKKNLREYIENSFSGSSRRNALRKIVPLTLPTPIIPGRPTGDFDEDLTKNQMFSDLNYYEDNFAGTGTWGMSLVAENSDSMPSLVKSVFDKGHTSNTLQFCDYICPRRGLILPILGALSLALLGFVLAQQVDCSLRAKLSRFDKPVFGSGLALIALWYLFVSCVPTWESYRYTMMIVVGVLMLISVWVWMVRRGRVDP